MSKRTIYSRCPNCRRRPGLFGYAVYRCNVCQGKCCEYCIVKGVFHLYCPHCGSRTTFEHIGYTR